MRNTGVLMDRKYLKKTRTNWILLIRNVVFSILIIPFSSLAQNPIKITHETIRDQKTNRSIGTLSTFDLDIPVAQFRLDTVSDALFVQRGREAWTGPKRTRDTHFYDLKTGEHIWSIDDPACKQNKKEFLEGIPYTICERVAVAHDPVSGQEMWRIKHNRLILHQNRKWIIGLDVRRDQAIFIYDAANGERIYEVEELQNPYPGFSEIFLPSEIKYLDDGSIIFIVNPDPFPTWENLWAGGNDLIAFQFLNFEREEFWWGVIRQSDQVKIANKYYPPYKQKSSLKSFDYEDLIEAGGFFLDKTGIYKSTEKYFMKYDFAGDTIWLKARPPNEGPRDQNVSIVPWEDLLLCIEFGNDWEMTLFSEKEFRTVHITLFDPMNGELISTSESDFNHEGIKDILVSEDVIYIMDHIGVFTFSIMKGFQIDENRIIEPNPYSPTGLHGFVPPHSYIKKGDEIVSIKEAYPNRLIVESQGNSTLILTDQLEIVESVRNSSIYKIEDTYEDYHFISNGSIKLLYDFSNKVLVGKAFSQRSYLEGSYIYDQPDLSKIEMFSIGQ